MQRLAEEAVRKETARFEEGGVPLGGTCNDDSEKVGLRPAVLLNVSRQTERSMHWIQHHPHHQQKRFGGRPSRSGGYRESGDCEAGARGGSTKPGPGSALPVQALGRRVAGKRKKYEPMLAVADVQHVLGRRTGWMKLLVPCMTRTWSSSRCCRKNGSLLNSS